MMTHHRTPHTAHTLRRRIMRRIYLVYAARSAASPLAVKCYLLVVFIAGMLATVSVSHVIANMPPVADVVRLSNFFYAAFVATERLAQLSLIGAFVISGAVAYDLGTRVLRTHRLA